MSTTTGRPFFACFVGFPGCLAEGDGPPSIHGDYRGAAEEIAETLSRAADGYEEEDEEGDRYEALSEQARASTEADGFGETGPDGLRYTVETIDPRGVWSAGEADYSDGLSSVCLSYGPAHPSDTTAEEAAEEISSVCGSMVEVEGTRGAGFGLAYVLVESSRLSEAAAELREAGFLLVDIDGDDIDPDGPEDLGPSIEAAEEAIRRGLEDTDSEAWEALSGLVDAARRGEIERAAGGARPTTAAASEILRRRVRTVDEAGETLRRAIDTTDTPAHEALSGLVSLAEVDPSADLTAGAVDRAGNLLDGGQRVRYDPDDPTADTLSGSYQDGVGTVRGLAISPDSGRVVVDIDDDSGGDTTWRHPEEVERIAGPAGLVGASVAEALSWARTLLDEGPGGSILSTAETIERIDRAISAHRRAGTLGEDEAREETEEARGEVRSWRTGPAGTRFPVGRPETVENRRAVDEAIGEAVRDLLPPTVREATEEDVSRVLGLCGLVEIQREAVRILSETQGEIREERARDFGRGLLVGVGVDVETAESVLRAALSVYDPDAIPGDGLPSIEAAREALSSLLGPVRP